MKDALQEKSQTVKSQNGFVTLLIFCISVLVITISILLVAADTDQLGRPEAFLKNSLDEIPAVHTALMKKMAEIEPTLVLQVNSKEIVLDSNWLMTSFGIEKDDEEIFSSIVSHHRLESLRIKRRYRLEGGDVPEDLLRDGRYGLLINPLYDDLVRTAGMCEDIAKKFDKHDAKQILIVASGNTRKSLLDRLFYTIFQSGIDTAWMGVRDRDELKQIEVLPSQMAFPPNMTIRNSDYCVAPRIKILDTQLSVLLEVIANVFVSDKRVGLVQGDDHWEQIAREIDVAFSSSSFMFDQQYFSQKMFEWAYRSQWEGRPRLNDQDAVIFSPSIQRKGLLALSPESLSGEMSLDMLEDLGAVFNKLPHKCGFQVFSADTDRTWGDIWQIIETVSSEQSPVPKLVLSRW